jgi:hypothetical protein
VGDPRVRLGAIAPSSIEIEMLHDLEPERPQSHRWLLHPLDDLAAIQASIEEYLRECRIEQIEVLAEPQRASPQPPAFTSDADPALPKKPAPS